MVRCGLYFESCGAARFHLFTIIWCGALRFFLLTVRCGAVRLSVELVQFFHFRNHTVRFGAVFVFRESCGAVRCGAVFTFSNSDGAAQSSFS